MTKILIPNYGNGLNRGAAALLSSRITGLKKHIPNCEFAVFSFNPELDPGIDTNFIAANDIKFHEVVFKMGLSPRWFFKTTSSFLRIIIWPIAYKFNFHNLIRDERFTEYATADLIVSVGGDVLTEDYGSISFISHFFNVYYGLMFNVPIIIFAESVGPFKKKGNRIIARTLLNKSSLILLREEISKENLKDLKISNLPIYVTNDSAFLLESASPERIKEILKDNDIQLNKKITVGISLSKIISLYGFPDISSKSDKYQAYIETMGKVIDYLISELDALVILIPHVMEPSNNDDREVNLDTYKLVNNKGSCKLIEEHYSAEELKGIIGVCDLFIGSRMHTTIASTSMLVPTIAIAYSHKTHGIIGELLKQEKYVIDINNFNYDLIISKINTLLNNKDEVIDTLRNEMNKVKEESLLSFKLTKSFYENTL